MKKIEFETVKSVFETTFPDLNFKTFEIALKTEIKRIKDDKKQKQIEEDKIKEVLGVLTRDKKLNDRQIIEEYIEEGRDWYDHFMNYGDDFPDYGMDDEIYVLIDDDLYLVNIHCSAQWISDWSVRANLPDEVTLLNITKVEEFSVIEKGGDYAIIKLK